nr:response regulator [Gemmatimonadaceae bacterium]
VRAERKHLELVLDLPDELPPLSLGDPGRLRQVLVNLCDNAIKFTHVGDVVVTIRSTPASDVADAIELQVRDTGIGIPLAQQERVFEAFRQVDASITREYGGTGLGLSITRQLVTRMGGTITLASEPGRGTTFTVRLVLPRAQETVAAVPPLRRFDGHTALVVDDHPLGRETVGRLLARWGFAVRYASDGDEALRVVQTADCAFDLFVVDGVMPRRDGFGFAEALRALDPTTMRRLLLLSSGGRRGDAARCRALGVRGFLTKPATPAELRELVTRVLSDVRTPAYGTALITRHSLHEQPRRLHVLLVEDNPVNQAVVQGMLTSLGHDVTIASDGEAALAVTLDTTFDLILMDLQMPRLDGMEATRRLRARDGHRARVPVVALTANAMVSARDDCLAAGMDEHLSKPVRLAQLQAVLARVGAGLGRPSEPLPAL